jgi:hypothetical protein
MLNTAFSNVSDTLYIVAVFLWEYPRGMPDQEQITDKL